MTMKTYHIIFLIFFLSSCSSNRQEERLLQDVENVLPGTWEIVRVNNLAAVDGDLSEVYYDVGNSISDFGTFSFSAFDLEFTEHNSIMSETINFDFVRDSVSYPLRIINQNIITREEQDFLQLDVVPNVRGQFEYKDTNIEKMIDELNLFHTPYLVDIQFADQITLRTSSTRDEISFDLIRIK